MRHVLIVEDDACLGALLEGAFTQAGYTATLASTGDAALELIRDLRPDAVVLDVNLPGPSGYELCHTVRDELGDEVGVVLMSGDRTESFDRVAGLLIGADDYLAKPFEPSELVARVRAVLRRYPGNGAREASTLTPREFEVLGLLADGRTQRSIASGLGISDKTVSTHIEHILAKLNVHSRAQAVAAAYRNGLMVSQKLEGAASSATPPEVTT